MWTLEFIGCLMILITVRGRFVWSHFSLKKRFFGYVQREQRLVAIMVDGVKSNSQMVAMNQENSLVTR